MFIGLSHEDRLREEDMRPESVSFYNSLVQIIRSQCSITRTFSQIHLVDKDLKENINKEWILLSTA
jgi:hypothetical protein